MRRLLVMLAAVVSLAGATGAGAATTTVTITKSGFSPSITTVAVGDTVTWTNKDTANHQITFDNGGFTSPVLKPGQTTSYTFSKSDSVPYRDKLNERLRAVVNVNAAGQISIAQNGFAPRTLTVAAGDTVTWTNRDTSGATHQVVADDGSFTSPILKRGESYTHVFANTGTSSYHDALHPSLKGSVSVGAAPPVLVQMQASRSAVVGGGIVTLSGSVAGSLSGTSVSILVQPTGQPQRTIDVTTDSNGAFSVQVRPQIGTTYQAVVKTAATSAVRAQSSPLTVAVSPHVVLRHSARYTYRATLVDQNAVQGHRIYLQRWIPRLHRYVTMTHAQLKAGITDSVFNATFRTKLRHQRFRAVFTPLNAGPGYITGYSNAVRS